MEKEIKLLFGSWVQRRCVELQSVDVTHENIPWRQDLMPTEKN